MSNSNFRVESERNKRRLVISIIIIVILAISNLIVFSVRKPAQQAEEHDLGVEYRKKFNLLDPNRRLDDPKDLITNIQPLRDYLKELPEQNKDWAELSIYFEVLKTGANITVNTDLKIWPASLAKLPVAMVTMRRIEHGDWTMETKLTIEKDDVDALRTPDLVSEIGRSYDIKFLLERLLLESDNTAYRMLIKNFTDKDLNSISEQIGLEELLSKDGKITSKEYTRLLRVLYLANYINEDNSQFLLKLMQDSEFSDFLRTGIPKEIPFFHKWGTNTGLSVYADSGIVYVPNKPYMISVMIQAKGSNESENRAKANKLMKEIAQKSYEYISTAQNK